MANKEEEKHRSKNIEEKDAVKRRQTRLHAKDCDNFRPGSDFGSDHCLGPCHSWRREKRDRKGTEQKEIRKGYHFLVVFGRLSPQRLKMCCVPLLFLFCYLSLFLFPHVSFSLVSFSKINEVLFGKSEPG